MRDPVDDEIDQPLHAYLHARGDVHPPDDLGDAVRLAMQTSPRRRWSTPLSGLAAAAVIVIAFGVAALALGPRMAFGPGPLAATDAPSITLPPSAHGSTVPTSAAAGSPVARTSRPVGYPSAPGTLLLSLRSTKCAGALCDPTVTVFTLTAGGMVSCRSFEAEASGL